MNKKMNVAILFGGKSAEHEVSLQSAKNVFEAINKKNIIQFLLELIRKENGCQIEVHNFLYCIRILQSV